ncbi:MAG: hypothetical protein AB8F95_15350 [Bacteroidia bacterium]
MKFKPLFLHTTFILIVLMASLSVQAQYYGTEKESQKPFSLGLALGTSALWGEVEPDPLKSYEVGLNIQQVLSSFIDIRIQLHHGAVRGLGRTPGDGLLNSQSWNGECPCEVKPDYTNAATPFYNHRTQYFDGSLHLKFNINRLFNKEATGWDLYLFGGAGGFMYQGSVDALDANGAIYDFSGIPSNTDQTVSSLRGLLDGNFETPAEQESLGSSIGEYALLPTLSGGFGVRFLLGEKFALGLEARYMDTNDYLVDGVRWNDENKIIGRNDKLISAAITFDILFNKSAK